MLWAGLILSASAVVAKYVPLSIELDHPQRIAPKAPRSPASTQQIVLVYEAGDAKNFLPELVAGLPAADFGLVVFGNASWRAAEEPPCGYWTDAKFSRKPNELRAYVEAHPHVPADPQPLNHFLAIIRASRFPFDERSRRIIVQVTRSEPHYYDDGGFLESELLKPTGLQDRCRAEYDPTPRQVRSSLLQRGCELITLVADPHYLQGSVGKAWTAFNRFLHQPDGFVNVVQADYSDVAKKLKSALAAV